MSDEEILIRSTARDFFEDRSVPIIEGCFREARFPRELVPVLGELGNLQGYSCTGLSSVEYGLVMLELERGDSGVRSFVSVQSALVKYPILLSARRARKTHGLRRLHMTLYACFDCPRRFDEIPPPRAPIQNKS